MVDNKGPRTSGSPKPPTAVDVELAGTELTALEHLFINMDSSELETALNEKNPAMLTVVENLRQNTMKMIQSLKGHGGNPNDTEENQTEV